MQKVKCPHCKKEFPLEEGLQEELQTLEKQAREKGRSDFEEKNKELAEKIEKQKTLIESSKALQESAVKNAREDEKLKSQTEMEKKELKIKRTEETNKSLQKIIERQKKFIEQGGSTDQGSAQEIILLNYLKDKVFKNRKEDKFFPYGKGKQGGDVLHEIIEGGQLVGKILYESKNTSNFDNKWTSKINTDLSDSEADVGIIFTRALPRYFDKDEDFYQDNNIFICQYDYIALRTLARINRLMLIDAKKMSKDAKSNQTGIIEFYNNPVNKNTMVMLSKAILSSKKNLEKIKYYADKVEEDIDTSDEELEELFNNLSKAGVHFKK